LDGSVFEPHSLVIVQKKGDAVNLRYEREEYRTMLMLGNVVLESLERDGKDVRAFSVIHPSLEVREPPLVEFWSDSYSKPYRDVEVFDENMGGA